MHVQETIPESLQSEVEAALGWFNDQQEARFEVTGIVDAEGSLASSGRRPLHLILCSGERCEQQSFEVRAEGNRYEVGLLAPDPASSSEISKPAELDPPPGPRRAWLDATLEKHPFVVLLFYRGFW